MGGYKGRNSGGSETEGGTGEISKICTTEAVSIGDSVHIKKQVPLHQPLFCGRLVTGPLYGLVSGNGIWWPSSQLKRATFIRFIPGASTLIEI